MDTNLIKLFAGHIIVVSEMDKETKRDLLTFVEHASDYQVKYFLLDATLVEDTKSDLARSIVDSKFDISGLPEKVNHYSSLSEGAVGSVAGMLIFSPVVWAAWRGVAGLVSRKRRECGTFRISKERDKCLEIVPIIGLRRKIELLTKAEKDCKQAPEPSKCMESAKKNLYNLKKKLDKKEEKYRLRWNERAI